MPRDLLTIEEVLSRLESGPGRIALLTAGLTEAQLRTAPAVGEWSANDILAHIRSCQDVWSTLVLAMLSEARPARKVIHPRAYIKGTDYLDLDFEPSLHALTKGRTELISVLSSLPPDAWARTCTARGWALVYQRSLAGQGDRMVRHEGAHIQQIEAVSRALRS